MAELLHIALEDRALVAVSGEDSRGFLQDLITADVTKVSPETAVHGALLTPQGKYLHDFFIFEIGGTLCLDCESDRRDDLLRRLGVYRLRAKVVIEAADDDLGVHALIGDGAAAALGLAAEPGRAATRDGGIVFVDPRLTTMGARAVLPAPAALEAAGFAAGDRAAYDALRLGLGVPDGSRDLVIEKALALENGFEELNGVDFDKGCYIGQEITARMKHRALVRKRLLPVAIDGPAPPTGTPVMRGAVEAGEMRSAADGRGLALLRLDHVAAAAKDGPGLTAGNATLHPRKPDWAVY